MTKRSALLVAMLCCLIATLSYAQDPVKVDPTHYKVELENAQVRILRIHYGAHEKSVPHNHPYSVALYLTDGKIKFTDANGKTQEATAKAGENTYTPAQVHTPENVGDAPFEAILVELKGGAK